MEAQQPLHDPEWLERASLQSSIPLTNTVQYIHSFGQYAEAMSQPCANGDELMVAMFCDLFNLRVVIVELTDATSSVAMQSDTLILSRVSLDILPRLPLSSDFTVMLVLSGNHYDWAHLSSGMCDDSESHCKMGKATEVVCYTSTPVAYVDMDPDFYTPISHSLLRNHTREYRRSIVKQCLVDEHDATPHDAELSIKTFEKLGGVASMNALPELLHLHEAVTYKSAPASAETEPAKKHSPQASPSLKFSPETRSLLKLLPPTPGRRAQSNELKRTTMLQEHVALDVIAATRRNREDQLEADTQLQPERDTAPSAPQPSQPPLQDNQEAFHWAVRVVQTVANCSSEAAACAVKRHQGTDTNYHKAVTAACHELSQNAHKPAAVPQQQMPVPSSSSDTDLPFVEQHLGKGVREMTSAELARAETAYEQLQSGLPTAPPMSCVVPKNLNNYWQHHLTAAATTPRGTLTLAQHAAAIKRAASIALHSEACDAAAAACKLDRLKRPTTAIAQPVFQTPQQHQSLPTMAAAVSAPVLPPPSIATDYQTHYSPAVRMAAARAEQAQSARSAATTVVVMAANTAKLLQWKAGEEKDCKGFYWSTKLAVQQAWEQHSVTEDIHGYRTFKSCIHCQMIPIICAELMISRTQFDAMQDADLIDRIDKRLKPTGPVDYLIKLRAIKFSHDTKDTLLHRYRAFAEPFLQLCAEAHDAGCAINDESVKLAFKEACRPNNLMMMWLHEQRWSGATNAHRHIMENMKHFDTLSTLQSLNGNQAPAARQHQEAGNPNPQHNQQAASPAQPQQQPYYSRAQREEFRRQQNGVQQQSGQPHAFPAASASTQQHLSQQQQQCAAPNPLYQPQAPQQQRAQVNVMTPAPAAAAAPYEHPGLDARGSHWHPLGSACRYSPCTVAFCQGCGEHGHSAAQCKKRNKHANWNYSGYYAEQRPGQPALVYDGPARMPSQLPPAQQTAQPSAFPTPHQLNAKPTPPPAAHTTAQSRNYTPVSRSQVNVAVQHQESNGTVAAQQ